MRVCILYCSDTTDRSFVDNPLCMQATAELHQQLRHGSFRAFESNPRMLPRLYDPKREDVNCSTKTPAKEPVAGAKRGRGAKAGAPFYDNKQIYRLCAASSK